MSPGKMKVIKEKIGKKSEQCSLCQTQFEIQLNNSKLSEERREKVAKHVLRYCPVCSKIGFKNKKNIHGEI